MCQVCTTTQTKALDTWWVDISAALTAAALARKLKQSVRAMPLYHTAPRSSVVGVPCHLGQHVSKKQNEKNQIPGSLDTLAKKNQSSENKNKEIDRSSHSTGPSGSSPPRIHPSPASPVLTASCSTRPRPKPPPSPRARLPPPRRTSSSPPPPRGPRCSHRQSGRPPGSWRSLRRWRRWGAVSG